MLDELVAESVDIVPLLAVESVEFIGIAFGSVVVVVVGPDVVGSDEVDGDVGDIVPVDDDVPDELGEPGVVVCARAAVDRPRAATPNMVTIRMEDFLLFGS